MWPAQDSSDGVDLARAGRAPSARGRSSSRTSAGEGTTRTRSPPCATCLTSTSTCRAAASIAGCSTTRLQAVGARPAALGRRHHAGDGTREAVGARRDRPGRRPGRHPLAECGADLPAAAFPRIGRSVRMRTTGRRPDRDGPGMTEPGRRRPGPLDVNTCIGPYPFRHVPHPDPDVLVRVLDREGLDARLGGTPPVGVPSRSVAGQRGAVLGLAPHRDRLLPGAGGSSRLARMARTSCSAPRRGRPGDAGVSARMWGLPPGDRAMAELAAGCAQRRRASLLLTVRFEDLRQRHPLDVAGDLPGGHDARAGTRRHGGAARGGCGGPRSSIEEVHWGLTAAERDLVLWDISWIWGPPEDDFAHLLRAIGARAIRVRERLAAATGADAARESGAVPGCAASGRLSTRTRLHAASSSCFATRVRGACWACAYSPPWPPTESRCECIASSLASWGDRRHFSPLKSELVKFFTRRAVNLSLPHPPS